MASYFSRPDHGVTAKPNESSKLSKSLAANGVSPSSITLEGDETDFLDQVCSCTDQDNLVVQALKELGTEGGLCSNVVGKGWASTP